MLQVNSRNTCPSRIFMRLKASDRKYFWLQMEKLSTNNIYYPVFNTFADCELQISAS